METENIQVEVHDLIELYSIEEQDFDRELPNWAVESLATVPYVVVRRGSIKLIGEKVFIPVGIRGKSRNERFGCYMLQENSKKIISPEMVVGNKMWDNYYDFRLKDILDKLNTIFQGRNKTLLWGPTGGVGFQLVTKHKVTNSQSDLDLLIKPNEPISVKEARRLLNEIWETSGDIKGVAIDIIMKANKGWVALEEYATGIGSYLIKTETGETLVHDIW